MKNSKKIFFVLTLLTLLIAFTAVNATDNTDNTMITDDTQITQDSAADTISTQQTEITQSSQKVVDTKKMEKETKNIKKDSLTIDGIEYTNIIEDTEFTTDTSINENTYINNCTASMTGWDGIENNAILYINNSNLKCYIYNCYDSVLYVNNTNLSGTLENLYKATLTNTLMNMTLSNSGNLTINEGCTYGDGYELYSNTGQINDGESGSTDPDEPITIDGIEYTNIIENQEITTDTILSENTYINNCNIAMEMWDKLTNNAIAYINNTNINATVNNTVSSQIYFENSIVNGKLVNVGSATFTNTLLNMSVENKDGVMTITDNCRLGEGLGLDVVYGEIIINDTSRLLPHQPLYTGNITFENVTLSGGSKNNEGNLTLINCSFAYTQQRGIINNGNLTLINSTVLNLNNQKNAYANNTTFSGFFQNSGNITLADDVSFNTSSFYNYGIIIINNSNIIYPYVRSFKGTHHLSNMVITKSITNEVGSTLTLSNVIINQTITNQGTLIIDDNCVFASGFRLNNYGNITINDTNRIYPYTSSFTGETTLSNITIDKSISNAGTMTLKNVTIAATISNNGVLIIDDNCTFTENAEIYDDGEIIINDTTRITPYLPIYNGEYTLENTEITTYKTNNGDLTIKNTTLLTDFYNYGTLTAINSTLNGYMINYGTLIISNDTIFGDDLYIDGDGEIITNQTEAITPFISVYNGNYTIIDTVLEDDKGNYGNLTVINSTLENYMTNYGNLTVINTVLNGYIDNDGILNISDDCTLGENLVIDGNGMVIYSSINDLAPYMRTLNGNYTLENLGLTGTKTNNGNLTLINVLLDCTMTNNGVLNISSDCEFGENFRILGNGQIICDDFTKILPYMSTINGTYTFEDWNITKDVNLYGDITLINCNINAKITNYENLTIINSSLSNNTKNVQSGKEDGFLINNRGKLEMINCVMENNTFDTSATYTSARLYGAIVNNGNMTITDSRFKNNKVGHYFSESYNNYYGNSFGNGSVVNNKGVLTISNSNFTENYAGSYGGAIVNSKNMTITNCSFNKNIAIVGGGAIGIDKGHTVIMGSTFTGNNATLRLTVNDLCGGGAIYASNGKLDVDNCTFDNNQAINYITGLAGVNSNGGSIAMIQMNATITNSTFKNHQKEVIQGGKMYYTYTMNATIANCLFENNKGGIIDYTKLNIINNTFKNTTGSEVINNMVTVNANKTISGNKFIDNNVTTETINRYVYFDTSILNITKEDNTYQNTTISDSIELNIPDEIYPGVDITITGVYTINNPDNYDANILEQNRFNIYVNGNLVDTVDELNFTITPTTDSMILVVQPTISQTRKIQSISSSTSLEVTITPENYDEYIYESELINVDPYCVVSFEGEFNDKEMIKITTDNIILDGENARFTNTVFALIANSITMKNMLINNTETDYPITNLGNGNTITDSTIEIRNTEALTAAIYSEQSPIDITSGSDTVISNNVLIVSGPADTINFDSGDGISDTQAILLIGGDNNLIIGNQITVTCSGRNEIYGTLDGITNSRGATNTVITQNNITMIGGNFNYGIDSLTNVENITITENIINSTGERYCDGIQVGNGVKNALITNNNITCVCINTTELTSEGAITYGVIASNMGSAQSINITINENNINLTGTANYGIELYKVDKTEIHDNNITVTGPFSMGIGYAYSPNGNATGNTITIDGDSTTQINLITEELKPENVGIRVQNGTQNTHIENNTIITNDVGHNDTTIHSDEASVTIINNILQSSTKGGDDSMNVPLGATTANNTSPNGGTTPDEDDESKYTTVIVTPSNISQYFDWSGYRFEPYTKAVFQGTFVGDEVAPFTTENLIIDGTDATFIKYLFSLQKSNITLQNINASSNNQKNYMVVTSNNLENIKIINSTFTINNTKTSITEWGWTTPLYTQAILIQKGTGAIIENNTINVYGPSIDQITDAGRQIPNTLAILIFNSTNVKINANTITIVNTTEPTEDSLINAITTLNSGNLTITNNIINSSGARTNTAINNTNPFGEYTEENNIINIEELVIEPKITLEPLDVELGEFTTITATITSLEEVNDGKVYFKINGKVLRDTTTGRIIYATLEDSVATLEYEVPNTWNEDTTIQAIYTGNDEIPKLTSESIIPTIYYPTETQDAEFSVEDVTAAPGSEVSITVNTRYLDGGKVVLKVNGKTVKADDGKVYVKVNGDTVTFTYNVPKTYKAGYYEIKAVYTYAETKLEEYGTLTVA